NGPDERYEDERAPYPAFPPADPVGQISYRRSGRPAGAEREVDDILVDEAWQLPPVFRHLLAAGLLQGGPALVGVEGEGADVLPDRGEVGQRIERGEVVARRREVVRPPALGIHLVVARSAEEVNGDDGVVAEGRLSLQDTVRVDARPHDPGRGDG